MANMNKDAKGKFACATELSEKQLQAVHMLTWTDKTKTQICEELGCERKTLWSWLKNDLFKEALYNERKAKFEDMADEAMKELRNVLHCEDNRSKLKACELVLKEIGHLDTKINIDAKTSNEIIISLVDDEEEE